MKMKTGLPLSSFRETYMKIRGHASGLLVSRANEGDHRNMKSNTRFAPNVSAALIMARLRTLQCLESMKTCAFIVSASRNWPTRMNGSIVNQLLEHRYPPWRLFEIITHEKVQHVYGSSMQSLFADFSAPAAIVSQYVQSSRVAPATARNTMETAFTRMLDSVFQAGSIVSLPVAVLQSSEARSTLTFSSFVSSSEDLASILSSVVADS